MKRVFNINFKRMSLLYQQISLYLASPKIISAPENGCNKSFVKLLSLLLCLSKGKLKLKLDLHVVFVNQSRFQWGHFLQNYRLESPEINFEEFGRLFVEREMGKRCVEDSKHTPRPSLSTSLNEYITFFKQYLFD